MLEVIRRYAPHSAAAPAAKMWNKFWFSPNAQLNQVLDAMNRSIVVAALLFVSVAVNADDEIYQRMERYFSDFNEGANADTLVQRYFGERVLVLSQAGVNFYESNKETSKWLGSVLEAIHKDGWLKSIRNDHSICMIGERGAVYTLTYDRIFSDGREVPGSSVYTLEKGDDWRIVGLIVTSKSLGMECPD